MKIIGAIELQTNRYTFPQEVRKGVKYRCPDCNEDLIFKKGIKVTLS